MPADGMKMSDLFLNPAARLLSHPDSASCVWINMNVGEWEENLTRLIKHNFGGNFAPGHSAEVWAPDWSSASVRVLEPSVARRGLHPAHSTSGLWSTGCQEKLPPGPGTPASTLSSHHHQNNTVNSPIRPHEKSTMLSEKTGPSSNHTIRAAPYCSESNLSQSLVIGEQQGLPLMNGNGLGATTKL